LIKDIEVESTLIDIHYLAEFKEVDINEIDVKNFVIVEAKKEEQTEPFVEVSSAEKEKTEIEEQMLMFDLPVNTSPEKKGSTSEAKIEDESGLVAKKIEDIEVNDAIEVVPVTEVTEEGVKRYSLDDYQEMEDALMNAKPEDANDVTEEEIVFETKTVDAPEKKVGKDEPVDPLN
jgi:cell division protein FtsZ